MDETLFLPGFSEPEPEPRRATVDHFIALVPDEDVLEQMWFRANLLRLECDLGDLRQQRIWHLTLRHLESTRGFSDGCFGALGEACAAVAKTAAPVEIILDGALSFDRKRQNGGHPFVLSDQRPESALRELRKKIDHACLRRVSHLKKEASFTPHVTVAYDRQLVAHRPIDPIHWIAKEVVLIRSHVGETRHEILGSWALEG